MIGRRTAMKFRHFTPRVKKSSHQPPQRLFHITANIIFIFEKSLPRYLLTRKGSHGIIQKLNRGIDLVKKIFINISALFFSIVLTVTCLELGLRFYQAMLDKKDGVDNAEAFLHDYDPIRGWQNKPSSSAEFVNREAGIRNRVTINSKGLRDQELSYEKPEGTLRILLLDASAIAGFEVPQAETVDAVLESLLNGPQKVQVINGATRAYGTDQSLLFLMSEGLRYQPDIIIYVVSELDLDDNLVIHKRNRAYGKSYFQIKPDGTLELRGTPVPRKFIPDNRTLMADPLAQKYADRISGTAPAQTRGIKAPAVTDNQGYTLVEFRKFLYERSALYRLVAKILKGSPLTRKWIQRMGLTREADIPKPAQLVDLEWRITSALLAEMKKVADQNRAKLAFYEFSNGFSPNADLERLAQVAQKLNAPLIRTYDVFHAAQASKVRPTFARDAHWNAEGHRLAAQIIYDFLKKQGWLSFQSQPAPAGSDTVS